MSQYMYQAPGGPQGGTGPGRGPAWSSGPLSPQAQTWVNSLVPKVYGWMFVALVISGTAAVFAASSGITQAAGLWLFVPLIGAVVISMVISWGINKISAGAATGLFVLYSLLMGVGLSTIFLAYNLGTIATAFFTAAVAYLAVALIGWTTKKDLSRFGGILMIALIGVFIAAIFAIFFPALWGPLNWIMLLVFLAIGVWETNVMKRQAEQMANADAASQRKFAIVFALSAYITFVNIFLTILRIMGNSR